jgi:hypothetical protein
MRGNIKLFTLSMELKHAYLSKLVGFEKIDRSLPSPISIPSGHASKLRV